MATQDLTLDPSQMLQALERAKAAFKAHADAVNEVADTYIQINSVTKGIKGTFSQVTEAGFEVTGMLREKNGVLTATVKKISQTTDALTQLRAEQKRVAEEGAKNTASDIFKGLNLDANTPDKNLGGLARAQKQLVAALAQDSKNGLQIAQQILTDLRNGVVTVETGIRQKIQAALIAVLGIERQITAETKKRADASKPSDPAKVSADQLKQLKSGIEGAFPIPSKAGLNSVLAYQSALTNLINLAAKGKVEFNDLVNIFNAISKNPTKSVATAGNLDEQRIESASQRVVAAFRAVEASAEAAEKKGKKAGDSLFISFNQFAKILEIQIVHRAFGALITGMQNAIGIAARLQVSISEIRTVAQQSGISFEEFQQRIRATSEEFGRPQVDVAEALYQGFSNQVIKTGNDLTAFNEVMRLSRITASTAANAMEAYSSVVNSYRLGNVDARQVTSELFKAVELGRFRLDEVAGSLGRVMVVGSQVGVTRQEVLGLMTTLTRNGVPAAEAMTQISGIMQALLKPTKDMKELMHSWGVENGFAAVQTFGFVGVLQKLFEAAQKGNADLAALFPNVRAFRGVLGGTAGGGTGDLESDIAQIQNARESADRAASIIGESAGDKFQKEMIKIQNFFINDFANSFLQTANKLAEPFGGIANAVKGAGTAITSIIGIIANLTTNLTTIISLNGSYTISIQRIVQAYLVYKGGLIALSVAQALVAFGEARIAAARLVLIGQQPTLMGFAVANVGVTTAQAVATAAWTLTIQAATIALYALPFVAVIAGAAGIVMWLTRTSKSFKDLEGDVARFEALSGRLRASFEREREDQQRADQADNQWFEGELNARMAMYNRALAEMRRQSNNLVKDQRELVQNTGGVMRNAVEAAASAMREITSNLTKKINDARHEVESSLSHVRSFADRESSRSFTAAFREAARQPTIHTNLRPLTDPQEIANERLTRQAKLNSLTQQQELIQNRIGQLQQEAVAAGARGDQEGIQSARRKYEEIRRLTDQLWEIQTQEGQQRAENTAIDLARSTGRTIQSVYDVNLQRLSEMQAQVRAQEEQTEARFRARQAQIEAAAAEEKKKQQDRERAFAEAFRRLQQIKITDSDGQIKPEFRGPGGAEEFDRQFDQQRRRMEQLAQAAGIPIATQLQLEQGLYEHQRAMRMQIEREIANFRIAEVQRVFAEEGRQIRELQQAGRNQRDAARGDVAAAADIPTQVGTQQRAIQELSRLPVPARNKAAIEEDTRAWERQRAEVIRLSRDLADAPEANRAAIAERLQQETRALSDIYRRIVLASAGNRTIPGTGLTGQEIAERSTQLEDTIARVVRGTTAIGQASQKLSEAEERSRRIQTLIQTLPENLRDVAAGFAGVGRAGGEQAVGINNMAEAVRQLNNELDRMKKRGPVDMLQGGPLPQLPPQQQGPANFIPVQGFASGGVIGGRFTGRGPDNRLIFARDGEMIVNSESTRKFYSTLVAINAGRMPKHYAQGGVVNNSNFGDVSINVDGSRSPSVTARSIMRELKREKRRGTGG